LCKLIERDEGFFDQPKDPEANSKPGGLFLKGRTAQQERDGKGYNKKSSQTIGEYLRPGGN